MKTRIGSALALLLLAACSVLGDSLPENQTRILFVGNSHTYNNDVPEMVGRLALADGVRVHTDMVAHGGWTLLEHLQSDRTIELIRSEEWDYVVLQEQSDVPSFPSSRENEMYPAIRGLHHEIAASGAVTVLFMTWGHRDGSLAEGVGGYGQESAVIERTYVEIGDELGVAIAPVGVAWWYAMQNAPSVSLWVDDGNHATPEGSYLAASVLYRVILGRSPEGNGYRAGLAEDWARFYQEIAAQTVSRHADRWNLP